MNDFTLATPTQEPDLGTAMKVVYQWNYGTEVEELRRLYVKAAEAQWVAERDIDWEQPIDLRAFATTPVGGGGRPDRAPHGAAILLDPRAVALIDAAYASLRSVSRRSRAGCAGGRRRSRSRARSPARRRAAASSPSRGRTSSAGCISDAEDRHHGHERRAERTRQVRVACAA